MQNPLVCLVILFCLGIVAAANFFWPFAFTYILAGIFLVLSFLFRRKGLCFKIILSCLVFLLGVLWLKNQLILPKNHIARHIFYKADNSCVLKGFVSACPRKRLGRTLFMFQAEGARFGRISYQVCGSVYVAVKGDIDLRYGDKLVLEGKLSRPYRGRGQKGRSKLLSVRQSPAIMNVEDPVFVIVDGQGAGSPVMTLALRLKHKAECLIEKYTPPLTAAILKAMILGDKSDIPPVVYRSMAKTGTVHIMVVSGFYTGIFIFCVFFLLKIARLPRMWRLLLALPILFFDCLIAGAAIPVIRAMVMSMVCMSAYLVKREPDIYNSCALSALLILLVEPRQLFDVGAQLSFASVVSIAYFYPKIRSLLHLEGKKPVCLRFFSEGFMVSASAWLGTVALTAYYFRILSPVALIANIFIVPLAGLITLCGFSLMAAAVCLPQAAPLFAVSAQAMVTLLIKANAVLVKLPGAYFYLP